MDNLIDENLLNFFNGDELASNVWKSKYALKDETTPTEMFERHAKEISDVEKRRIKSLVDSDKRKFFSKNSELDKKIELLSGYGRVRYSQYVNAHKNFSEDYLFDFKNIINFDNIILGGSMLQGIGNHSLYSSLSNCFVLGAPHDSYSGINKKTDEIVQVMKRRGGAGLDLSTIRPYSSKVNNQSEWSSGPVLFAERYSDITKEVAQYGRRGALMLTIDIEHPDSIAFAQAKQDLTKITGANISLKLSDEFMYAVENDLDYIQRFPTDSNMRYVEELYGIDTKEYNKLYKKEYSWINGNANPPAYYKKIKAKEAWNIICECACNTAEPGILFKDNWIKYGTDGFYDKYKPISTNPCFSGDTPLLTKNGYKNLIDLVGKDVEVWNGSEWSNVQPKITGENQEMLKITLSNGSILKCTKYHNWPIWNGFSRGGYELMVEAKKLNVGDKISKFKLPLIEFDKNLDEVFAYSQGFYCGDGTASKNSVRLYGEKIKLSKYLKGNLIGETKQNYYDTDYINFIFSEKMFDKYFVPIEYSIKTKINWLAGIIDADGTVDECGACQITNTNIELIEKIRLMLDTLGIQANINDCHKEGIKSLPDQKGGSVNVLCKATKRILIRGLDIRKLISLGMKTYRCNFDKYKAKRDASRFITIKSIEKIPNEEFVYCFNEPKKHKAIFNGILLGQCSEIPMQPYDACRLLSVNLFKLVNYPFDTVNCSFDFHLAYKIFYEQLTVGDIIIDLEMDYIQRIIDKIKSDDTPDDLKNSEIEIWNKISSMAKDGRRCGAGFTGLGDSLAALGLKYNDSKATIDFIEELFKIKCIAEIDATTDMAILYGAFEGFNTMMEKVVDNKFLNNIKLFYPEGYAKMMKYGRRNVSWSTAAPVGSGSILTQVTSGIEPLFMPYYKRRKKCISESERVDYIDPADGQKFTEYFVMHPKFIEYYYTINSSYLSSISDAKRHLENLPEDKINLIFVKSPWFDSCANDINWEARVKIQSIVQKYTTHAISSTINLPSDTTSDLIGKIYMESWKSGLKGNTVYRDGSRGGILVSNNEVKATIKKRPRNIPAIYHTIKYRNKTYSIIIGLIDNKPYEIFIVSGINNLPENLETNDVIRGELIREDKDWYNFESSTFLLKEIPDTEHNEKLLSLMLSGLLRNNTPIVVVNKILEKTKPIAGSFTHRLIKVLSNYIPDEELNGKACPECSNTLVYENGCVICKDCGWTKC